MVAVLYCFLNGEVDQTKQVFSIDFTSHKFLQSAKHSNTACFPGAARAPEALEKVAANAAPAQSAAAEAAARLPEPQQLSPHAGPFAALHPASGPHPLTRHAPAGYRGDVSPTQKPTRFLSLKKLSLGKEDVTVVNSSFQRSCVLHQKCRYVFSSHIIAHN